VAYNSETNKVALGGNSDSIHTRPIFVFIEIQIHLSEV
jgi:hypothetical protein